MNRFVGRRRAAALAGVIGCLVVVSGAVAASSQSKKPDYSKLKGTITADGSSTLGPWTTAAAELFSRAGAKGVRITVGISGTGGGFERFCKGETDISNASRPMRVSEAQRCKDSRVGGWRAFHVANDALTVVVNPQNTWAQCLSTAELKAIWEPGSKINNWKDVRAGFPDVPLKLFGPGTDSGTFDYFTEAINGRSRASRTDFLASEDDNVLVQGVAGERGGLGYFGFSYYDENKSRLKAAQIRNPRTGQCVTPSVATVHNKAYQPLARPLFIYTKASSFRKPELQAFIGFALNNQAAVASRADFVRLTPAQKKRAYRFYLLSVRNANKANT
jgi:phosphate transport system substrate-binding protein